MGLDLPFEKLVLGNGLKVILHQDRTLPLVAVDLWYYVGSKDEPLGRSGFAHLFEHLMFMGTERVPGTEFDHIIEEGGGSNNASTSRDRTNYYASGPRALLSTLLWLEADRMESLGRSITQEKLDLQRDVVRNERRQSYENRPYGATWLTLPQMLHPEGHPYHLPVIGSHEDLEAATVADVQDFFASWYVPNNAALVVAGDFEADEARGMVEDLFGDIQRRPDPLHRSAPPPRLDRVVQRELSDAVPATRTVLSWQSPPHFAPGDGEMDLLAGVLAEGAASRLQQALMHRRRLVQDVNAFQLSGQLASSFHVAATVLPDVPVETVERTIDEEIARLLAEGPTAEELERNVAGFEALFLRGLQSLTDRADALNMYEDALGDPGSVERDLDRYRSATPDTVRAWCRTVLGVPQRAILRIVPEAAASGGGQTARTRVLDRDHRPERPPDKPWSAPVPDVVPLSGTGTLWLRRRDPVPLVALRVVVPGGAAHDPSDRPGLHSLVAELRTEGAGDRDAAAFDAALDRLGADIGCHARRFSTVVHVSALTRSLEETLDLFADLVLRPRLAEEDFGRVQAVRHAALVQRRSNPSQVAALVANRMLFGESSPWAHPLTGFPAGVAAVTHDDVAAAQRSFEQGLPEARLVLVGDCDRDRIQAALEERLAGVGPPAPAPPAPAPADVPPGLRTFLVHRADAPQTVVRVLLPGPPLLDEDTPALWLANAMFGGSFTSRLNLSLREKHGFTYGASSVVQQGRTVGMIAAASSVKAECTGPALREVLAEFGRLETPDFSAHELSKALATVQAQALMGFQGVGEAAAFYALFAAVGADPGALRATYEHLGRVTLEEAGAVASRWLVPRRAVVVLVGDRERTLPQLEGLGLPAPSRIDEEGVPVTG